MYTDNELESFSLSEVMEEYIRLRLTQTYSVIKYKCEKNAVPFDFNVDDLAPFPLRCPVLDIEIDYFKKGQGGSNHSPSIDRLIPEKGYITGNVRIISQKANRLKQDASVEEQVQLLAYSSGVSAKKLKQAIKKGP